MSGERVLERSLDEWSWRQNPETFEKAHTLNLTLHKQGLSGLQYKTLKKEYAGCECGNGYFYDVEADKLQKLKFIKILVRFPQAGR